MFTIHPRDAQVFTEERVRVLRGAMAVGRARRTPHTRRVFAECLRSAANRVDRAPHFAPHAA